MLREVGGKGPYCSLVMAVVVVKDVLVFVAFAINLELAMAAVGQASGGGMGALSFVQPLLSLATSVLLGGGAGVALGAALRPGWRAALLPAPLAAGARTAVPLLAAGATFLLAEALAAEPLLACVTAGLVVANRRCGGRAGGPPDAWMLRAACTPTLNPAGHCNGSLCLPAASLSPPPEIRAAGLRCPRGGT